MAATIFDHPGFLLLIVFVALVRWLASKAKSQTQNQQTPPPPPPVSVNRPIPRGGDTQTEEERIRKFLEALGQPPGTTTPKVAPRQKEIRPRIFPQLPPLTTTPPPLVAAPRTRAMPPPLPVEDAAWKAPAGPERAFEVRDVTRQASSEPASETRYVAAAFDPRIKLGTPRDLRTAIILREVFGPPRSLQPLDLTN